MGVTGKALWYIESHLNGDLSLEAIAGSVGVSRFHLSRAFPASTAQSLADYVRGRRLSEAARILAEGAPDILGVALNSGYGSHEAFTRAFRQLFGLTPEQLRTRASFENLNLQDPIRMDNPTIAPIASPRIMQGRAMNIFGPSQRYNSKHIAAIPSQWMRFVPYLGQIPTEVGYTTYGVIYNGDGAANFDYLCGVEVTGFPEHPAEFTRLSVAAQTYAVFEHREHISSLKTTFDYVWNQGLPNSGYRAVEAPTLEVYGEQFNGRTGLGGLEIWVPVYL